MHDRPRQDGREQPNAGSRNEDETTIHLDASPLTADRAARYGEWAERLRRKREMARERIQGSHTEEQPSYWSTDSVFRESRRLMDEEVPALSDPVVSDLLAVFGIVGEPTPRQVETAFRRLAKQHHPDRHVDADEATRAYHLDQMRRVNEAYARLRQLQLT